MQPISIKLVLHYNIYRLNVDTSYNIGVTIGLLGGAITFLNIKIRYDDNES